MKTLINVILSTTITLLVFSGCTKTPKSMPVGFLPGECLTSAELILRDDVREGFDFNLQLSQATSFFDDNPLGVVCIVPPKDVWQQFGDNSEYVKQAYFSACESIIDNHYNGDGRCDKEIYTSVYTVGDIFITSNKTICGVPAGENLSGLFKYYSYNNNRLEGPELSIKGVKGISLFAPESCMPYAFRITKADNESIMEVEQGTELYVSIPVRVGLYLHWLNDKLAEPDSQMEYRDEVLTCTIRIDNLPANKWLK